MHWFGNVWEGKQVDFPAHDGKPSTSWVLGKRLADEGYNQHEAKYLMPGEEPDADTAWAMLSCTRVGDSGPVRSECVMKIYMQIPRDGTESDSEKDRALQARSDIPYYVQDEIDALQILADKKCTSTPRMIDCLQDAQEKGSWVPGGFILYIVITRCSGKPIESLRTYPDAEQEEIRAAFTAAYRECVRCGVVNWNNVHGCLLWDNASRACYFVDFQHWAKATPASVISDSPLIMWGMKEWEPSKRRVAKAEPEKPKSQKRQKNEEVVNDGVGDDAGTKKLTLRSRNQIVMQKQ
ncbi:hypothetical protein F5884DRAFT_85545 [Xylogone sp. PMI_703]|nr:hypothetical protein F5884DRAFT_85545 [Xylogone sp. PMI_703]